MFLLLKEKINFLLERSVDGACSISSSRRIKYSKFFENSGDDGGPFVIVVDLLLLLLLLLLFRS